MTPEHWSAFVGEWQQSYGQFIRSFDPDSSEFLSVNEHHLTYLQKLLRKWNIPALFTEEETWDLAFC